MVDKTASASPRDVKEPRGSFGEHFSQPVEIAEMVSVDKLLDSPIVVVDAADRTGEFGLYLIVVFRAPGEDVERGFTTGSKVLVPKIRDARDRGLLPLKGTITKPGDYYDIV